MTVNLGGGLSALTSSGLSAPNVSESPTSPERSKGAELHEDAGSTSLAAVGPFFGGDSGQDPVAVKSPLRVKSKQTAPVMVDQADDRVILLQRTPVSESLRFPVVEVRDFLSGSPSFASGCSDLVFNGHSDGSTPSLWNGCAAPIAEKGRISGRMERPNSRSGRLVWARMEK
jgi:hypothetical protein